MKNFIILLLLFGYFSCKQTTQGTEKKQSSKLLETFAYKAGAPTMISAHRGGKGIKHYPENCLETLQYLSEHIENIIFEIDVAKTKDNVLVLIHDNTLDRTTTGKGKITSLTYRQLQAFNLKDDFGNVTSYRIPKFKDVLKWAKSNNVILTIDIKRSVAVENVVELINKVGAQDIAIIITYDMKQAERAHKLAPGLLLSVSARNEEELDWLIHSGIPTQNMIAFTGTRLSSESLYDKIHSYGIKTILGTLGNLDNQAKRRGDSSYKYWSKKGIDVLATDRPFQVYKALNQ